MTFIFRTKKGSVLDLLFIGLFIIIIGIVVMMFYKAFTDVKPLMLDGMQEPQYNKSREILEESHQRYNSVWDALIVFLFVSFWIVTIITSLFIDTHPVFFIVSLFIFIVILFAFVFINNFFINLASVQDFLFMEAKFPMTYWICSHIFMMSILIGASIMLVLYGRAFAQ